MRLVQFSFATENFYLLYLANSVYIYILYTAGVRHRTMLGTHLPVFETRSPNRQPTYNCLEHGTVVRFFVGALLYMRLFQLWHCCTLDFPCVWMFGPFGLFYVLRRCAAGGNRNGFGCGFQSSGVKGSR